MTTKTFLYGIAGVWMAVSLMACGNKTSNSSNGSSSSENTTSAPTSVEQQAAPSTASTDDAPDFTLTDIQGKPLTLSSLRGKYVVLDFWGSWCVWCVKGMPKMKEYYSQYKGKFEIIGIDCGDTDGDWRKAVNDLQLPWLHVYCPDGSKVLEDYGIQGFPTKVVISPDGKVDNMVIGEDPKFYTYLDQILG